DPGLARGRAAPVRARRAPAARRYGDGAGEDLRAQPGRRAHHRRRQPRARRHRHLRRGAPLMPAAITMKKPDAMPAPMAMLGRLRRGLRPEARRVLLGLGAGVALAVGYALLAPRWYQSRLVAVPTATRGPQLSLSAESINGSADLDLGGSDV